LNSGVGGALALLVSGVLDLLNDFDLDGTGFLVADLGVSPVLLGATVEARHSLVTLQVCVFLVGSEDPVFDGEMPVRSVTSDGLDL
jgi:hypothetical protein